jgi:hypothetical protein
MCPAIMPSWSATRDKPGSKSGAARSFCIKIASFSRPNALQRSVKTASWSLGVSALISIISLRPWLSSLFFNREKDIVRRNLRWMYYNNFIKQLQRYLE